MKIFVNKYFDRFMKKKQILDSDLCKTVRQIEEGSIDANLGGGVIKQRLSRANQGKSSGFRTVIIFRIKDVSFFVFGFAKSDRENINKDELKDLKSLAKILLGYDKKQLNRALIEKSLREVKYE
ncbi:type II toxin-antitoxin system RelE/ParE family toxin [bacterium]|nr:type II toxin-antitoxin system RelE/ParE family toxin [bacterium]